MYHPFYGEAFVNITVGILAIWTVPWKIYAVWTAAKRGQKKWFVALLILNTLSILELIYIFKVAGKSWDEVKEDFKSGWRSLRNK